MGRTVVVAEKPSVARDIARVLGCREHGEGYISGNGYVVTWAVGHLVGLAQPHEVRPEWRTWRLELLSMVPETWSLRVLEQSREQFAIVKKLLTASETARVVCATDAGREGELIFRNIYEASGCNKPVQRLWISSLTPDAIRSGFDDLRPAGAYDALANAAKGRSRADWLVGMNLTRAYTLASGAEVSVGRVQTPTLAMIVERDVAIECFVADEYAEIEAVLCTPAGGQYTGKLVRREAVARVLNETPDATEKDDLTDVFRFPPDVPLQPDWKGSTGVIARVDEKARREPPPLLFDLTELQRVANRLFGYSAKETLDFAQALYEKHKLLSYPRTDSRYLAAAVVKTLPTVLDTIRDRYGDLVPSDLVQLPLGPRWVNDGKVSDHHAIIPTSRKAGNDLSTGEQRIYDVVCRRLLSCWHGDNVAAITTVFTGTVSERGRDLWLSKGVTVLQIGWKEVDLSAAAKQKEKEGTEPIEPPLPAGLERGVRVQVADIVKRKKKTRAPARFNEASLLTAMESAGRAIEDKELSDAMKDKGLGTPATRAAIIEILIQREYVVRKGRTLVATQKGRDLIDRVDPHVKSALLTGEWEAYLKRIERGDGSLGLFIGGIQRFVTELVAAIKSRGVKPIWLESVTRNTKPGGGGTRKRPQRPGRPTERP